jgi:hypothetical protein
LTCRVAACEYVADADCPRRMANTPREAGSPALTVVFASQKSGNRGSRHGGGSRTSSLRQCVSSCSDLGSGVVGGCRPGIWNLAAWKRILAKNRDVGVMKLKERLGMGSPFPIRFRLAG